MVIRYGLDFLLSFRTRCTVAPEGLGGETYRRHLDKALAQGPSDGARGWRARGPRHDTRHEARRETRLHKTSEALHRTTEAYKVGATRTEDPEEEQAQKRLKSLLNKITKDNFTRLTGKIADVVNERGLAKTLSGFIDQIFDKALAETHFAELYADLVASLNPALPSLVDDKGNEVQFRRALLHKCQLEFETGATDTVRSDATAHRRMLGNIEFVGNLFKKGMLTESVVHTCVRHLLDEDVPRPEDVECMCRLLATAGRVLDASERFVKTPAGSMPTPLAMDAYFARIGALSRSEALDQRHRFMLLDLVDQRRNGWRPRRQADGPKTIEEIHREALSSHREALSSHREALSSHREARIR